METAQLGRWDEDPAFVSRLVVAAMTGLMTVPPGGREERLRPFLNPGAALTSGQVRDLAAGELEQGIEFAVEHDGLGPRLRAVARLATHPRAGTEDLDEIAQTALTSLFEVSRRYRLALGPYYGGLAPKKLFPVKDNFYGWARSYVLKAAFRFLEEPPPRPMPPGNSDENNGDPEVAPDWAPPIRAAFELARDAALADGAVSPDLRATVRPGDRRDVVQHATLEALNAMEVVLVGGDSSQVVGDCVSRALRAVLAGLPAAALDKRVERFRADVVFAVAWALDATLERCASSRAAHALGPRATDVLTALAISSINWRAAQCEVVAFLLSKPFTDPVPEARVRARIVWAANVGSSLSPSALASTHRRILAMHAAAGLDRLTTPIGTHPSPLDQAHALIDGAIRPEPTWKGELAVAITRLHDVLSSFLESDSS